MAATYVNRIDLGAGTCSVELFVGSDSIATYSYANSSKTITVSAQTITCDLTLSELLLFVEALRLWSGVLFKAFRPADVALSPFVRAMVTSPTVIELDDAIDGIATLDWSYNRTTHYVGMGTHPAAVMSWTDFKKWFTFVELYAVTCTEEV